MAPAASIQSKVSTVVLMVSCRRPHTSFILTWLQLSWAESMVGGHARNCIMGPSCTPRSVSLAIKHL